MHAAHLDVEVSGLDPPAGVVHVQPPGRGQARAQFGPRQLGNIAAQQTSIISFSNYHASWGIFTQPAGFVLFLTAAIAETKRTPFDIPEGEPEIIGYFVEYSGLRFGMFFLGEFLEIVVSSAIMITLFFGGWHWGSTIDSALIGHLPNLAFVPLMFLLWTIKDRKSVV